MEYVAKGFSQIDPVYNSVPNQIMPQDWSDLADNAPELRTFFSRFYAVNGGRNGISVPMTRDPGVSLVASAVFDIDDISWPNFKRKNLKDWINAFNIMANRVLEIHQWPNLSLGIKLTRREYDCLYWASTGKSDLEIANILGISRWTVIAHIQSAKYKLGAFNRTGAVVKAVALGLIKPGKPKKFSH